MGYAQEDSLLLRFGCGLSPPKFMLRLSLHGGGVGKWHLWVVLGHLRGTNAFLILTWVGWLPWGWIVIKWAWHLPSLSFYFSAVLWQWHCPMSAPHWLYFPVIRNKPNNSLFFYTLPSLGGSVTATQSKLAPWYHSFPFFWQPSWNCEVVVAWMENQPLRVKWKLESGSWMLWLITRAILRNACIQPFHERDKKFKKEGGRLD